MYTMPMHTVVLFFFQAADGIRCRTVTGVQTCALPISTVVCGDMNIAPTDDDVFDPDAYIGQTHVTPPERAALSELQALGLRDVVRERWPDERVFTYWDYRAGMFHQ